MVSCLCLNLSQGVQDLLLQIDLLFFWDVLVGFGKCEDHLPYVIDLLVQEETRRQLKVAGCILISNLLFQYVLRSGAEVVAVEAKEDYIMTPMRLQVLRQVDSVDGRDYVESCIFTRLRAPDTHVSPV